MYINQPLFSNPLNYIPSFPFFSVILHLHHMTRRKGKRKASPSPAASSSSVDNDNTHLVHKRSRRNSPARVREVALAKVASKSKSNSSSKGLAGFAALVSNANLSAARTETSRGLRSSSSSKFHGVGSKSRDEKTVRILFSLMNLITYKLILCTLGGCFYSRHDCFSGCWHHRGTKALLVH